MLARLRISRAAKLPKQVVSAQSRRSFSASAAPEPAPQGKPKSNNNTNTKRESSGFSVSKLAYIAMISGAVAATGYAAYSFSQNRVASNPLQTRKEEDPTLNRYEVVTGATSIAQPSPDPSLHRKYIPSTDVVSGIRDHITRLEKITRLDSPDTSTSPPPPPPSSPPPPPSSSSPAPAPSSDDKAQLKTRVREYHTNTFSANDPIEDTFKVLRDPKTFPGILFGVFDGHSGSPASHFCRDDLFSFITNHYMDQVNRNGWASPFSPPYLTAEPFVAADQYFLDNAFKAKDVSGACVNVVHINGDVLRTANIGDCRAVVGQKVAQDQGPSYRAVPLSVDHDLKHNQDERRRLISEHPGEPDIIRHYRIKGHLQPTRGIGDGVYKRIEFLSFRPAYMDQHKQWTPPYSSAVPIITNHTLVNNGSAKDEFVILASDGLFQDLSSEEVVQYVAFWQQHHKPSSSPPSPSPTPSPSPSPSSASSPSASSPSSAGNGKGNSQLTGGLRILQNVAPQQLEFDREMCRSMNAASFLVYQALSAAARRSRRLGASPDQALLHNLFSYKGDRRRIHDDVTVMVVFFDDQPPAAGGLVNRIKNFLVPTPKL